MNDDRCTTFKKIECSESATVKFTKNTHTEVTTKSNIYFHKHQPKHVQRNFPKKVKMRVIQE